MSLSLCIDTLSAIFASRASVITRNASRLQPRLWYVDFREGAARARQRKISGRLVWFLGFFYDESNGHYEEDLILIPNGNREF